ncbi:MAG: M23 family metallopeptidase [Spirochaetes bacterium]|nr:M23 family metallopeptidase [Spirochaetota bacterium]
MRFRIKQYNNKLQKQFSEKNFLVKKRISRIRDNFLEKGHEKMTIMLIPHNEKNIFNFHISKFIILFFISLFIIVIITSSYAIIKNAAINSKKDELLNNYKDIRSHLLRFEMLTNDTAKLINEIKPYIEDIHELTKGDNDADKIWEAGEGEILEEDINKLKYVLPEEIFTLKELQKDLECSISTIKTAKSFIDTRSKVIKDIPSIIPNEGNITSLFGWRKSPFGFGREFHTGIDIGAHSGTEIRATAPGVVTGAGWAGGYGYLVRIKHKYGYESLYGHCSKIKAKIGTTVNKGQVVAYVGQTGSATGNHCHYEIRLGKIPINPYPYMSRVW